MLKHLKTCLPLILYGLCVSACIDAPPSTLEREAEQGVGEGLNTDSEEAGEGVGAEDAEALGGKAQAGGQGGAGAGLDAGALAGGEPLAGEERVTAVDPPPPPEGLRACDRFCQRAQDCLYPACEDLQQLPPERFCEGWCGGDNRDWLNQSAELSCEDFNSRIFGFSPEVRALCLPLEESRCEQICDFGEVCGLVSTGCLSNCESADLGAQLCFSGAATTGDCGRFLECLQGGGGDRPNDRPDLNQLCGQLCNRESQCILDRCAAGSIDGSYIEGCFNRCIQSPDPRALQERAQLSCEERVEEARRVDLQLDERCDLDEVQACASLCESLVTPCGALEAQTCEDECAAWGEARFVCFSRTTQCDEVNACLVPPEEASRCDRLCTHLEGCLLEACPPRIIPTQLMSSCSADCFNDPVSEEDLTSWEASSCADVRNVVYRDNPQLRPICEGNQDFRPSPEECSAFCDQALGACLIGGDALCLSACASFTRVEYECSLAAQGECAEIDLCLTEG